jgi:hypothetical protein
MEGWNTGILEENNLGRDERLLVLGTQTRLRGYAYGGQARAPCRYSVSPPLFHHSHLSAVGIAKADIPSFQ